MSKKSDDISKSQYLKGIQCPKALWLYRKRPDLKPDISEAQQYIFDTGHDIGQHAQQYFKNGIEITEEYYQIDKAVESTQNAIKDGHNIIFEATACSNDGAYSKIDILRKASGKDSWDLIEVKATTGVKAYHIDDAAFQRHAFVGAGYDISGSYLMHLNNAYVRNGDLDLNQLFILEDITQLVLQAMEDVPNRLKELLAALRKRTEPVVEIGGCCSSPFECDYRDYCWQHIPDYSVYNIFRDTKLDTLLSNGVISPKDVPDDFDMTERQQIEIQSAKSGAVFFDKNKIKDFMNSLGTPIYYLDYETVAPAIPLFDNSSPYQQIPFQFSLHTQNKLGGKLKHTEFLHTEKSDPRPHFIEKLLDACGSKGTVLVYNKAFESRINNELGQTFSKYKKQLYAITSRMVDLMVPFKSRFLYHPEMQGSASIKSVLPAFVPGMSYEDLDISDGGEASRSYLKCLRNNIPQGERDSIFKQLKEYCGQDTLAEVELLNVLDWYCK